MILPPTALICWAVDTSCSSSSIAQGPAINTASSPPMTASPTLTWVESALKSLLANLKGFKIGTTLSTPAIAATVGISSGLRSPMAPMIVLSTPCDRWIPKPALRRCSWIRATCSSGSSSGHDNNHYTLILSYLSTILLEIIIVIIAFHSSEREGLSAACLFPEVGQYRFKYA